MRVLSIMDPVERINPAGDTTLVLIEELVRRGHEVALCSASALELDGEEVGALAAPVAGISRCERPCIATQAASWSPIAHFDAVLVRQDPPFDQDYLFATLLLERAREKTLIVNDPRGLREANEKLYIFNFSSLVPATRVTRSLGRLREFLAREGGHMIVKPLDGCGGGGVFHVRQDDRNANAILEMVTCNEKRLVMAQAYLPAVRQGDKRILLLDGEPIGAVLRVPRDDETRSNLHAGGHPQRCGLDSRDLTICATLAPRLRADGLYFVGIDVIGGWLTEVNVTSPTGVQEIDRLDGVHLEGQVVDWLERRARA